MPLCSYGCGQEAKYTFKNGKQCCSKSKNSCSIERNKSRERFLGKNNPMFGKVGIDHPAFGKGYLISGEKNPNFGKFKKDSPVWKGGSIVYWHDLAWKLFGKDKCEICGKTNEDHIKETKQRLSMHCTSIPKDYTLMEKSNWVVSCQKCHVEELDATRWRD